MSSSRDAPAATATYADAVAAFRTEDSRWAALPFFTDGSADVVAAKLDERVRAGARVLPAPASLFAALEATPLDAVKAVILGQDPYPTPGDAHGLAFSVMRTGKLPPSLVNIFKELEADLGVPHQETGRESGDLRPWADNGVLLLNPCLSVEAGNAGCHRRLGWERLADEVIAAVSAAPSPAVFILWGNDARRRKTLIDPGRHLIIESAHPSPLSARNGFFGSRPFSRANAYLADKGRSEIDWRIA